MSGGHGLTGDIPAGILGAVVSGWLGSVLLGVDVSTPNYSSAIVSLVGAGIAILTFRHFMPDRPGWHAWRSH